MAVAETHNELQNLPVNRLQHEYFDFPRGRVLYDVVKQAYIVYCDRRLLNPKDKTLIADFYAVSENKIIWKVDPHYVTEANELGEIFR